MAESAGRWLRVSSMGQDEASQEPDVDRWIADREYEVYDTYRAHGASAFHGRHEPELRRAMAEMKAGRIRALVIWRSDRVDRQEKLGALIKEAQEYGGRLEFVKEPELNALSGLGGRVMTVIKEFVNFDESKTKSDRVKAKQARLRSLGSFASGKAPTGYDIALTGEVVEKTPLKTLRPNGYAPVIRRVFAEAAAGKTMGDIARGLTADGIPTKTGNEAWAERTIGQILASPVYRGIVTYQGRAYMTVEALVPASDWLAANKAVKDRYQSRGHGSRGRPMGSKLRPACGRCSGPMYRNGPSYSCAGLGPMGNSALRKSCGNIIRAEELEGEVLREFEEYDEPEIIETRVPGRDYAEDIARVQLAIRDLDALDDDYDARHGALVRELRALRALPSEPERVTAAYTGRSEGDAFKAMTPGEQRAFIRLWTLTVLPPGQPGRRWRLER
jgi:site-specific DNA recombinase